MTQNGIVGVMVSLHAGQRIVVETTEREMPAVVGHTLDEELEYGGQLVIVELVADSDCDVPKRHAVMGWLDDDGREDPVLRFVDVEAEDETVDCLRI